jgi:hypothetical protein
MQKGEPTRRGRPDTGIRREYIRVEVALPPAVYDAVARLADRREVQTGKSTRRADVIRDALIAYLREHLPDAGV